MTSTGQGRTHCLSSAGVLHSTLPDETSSQLFVPFDRPFSSQSHLLVRPVLGHVLHAAEFKVLGGR